MKEDFLFLKNNSVAGNFYPKNEQLKKFKYIDEVLTPSLDIKEKLTPFIKTNQIYYAFDKKFLNSVKTSHKKSNIIFR